MSKTTLLTAPALALGALIAAASFAPAQAMPMAAPTVTTTPPATLIQVRDHCGRREHRRADHRFHGRDDYYDNDDQSGMLFKSFITGTLFR